MAVTGEITRARQPLGRKGRPVGCAAPIVGLTSTRRQSKSRWFVGAESWQQGNGPEPGAVGREASEMRAGGLQPSNVCSSVLLKSCHKTVPRQGSAR